MHDVQAVQKSLLEHGIDAVCLHGNVHPDKRKQAWRVGIGTLRLPSWHEAWDAFAGRGKADVMVCTNLASRGLDFSNVHHAAWLNAKCINGSERENRS